MHSCGYNGDLSEPCVFFILNKDKTSIYIKIHG